MTQLGALRRTLHLIHHLFKSMLQYNPPVAPSPKVTECLIVVEVITKKQWLDAGRHQPEPLTTWSVNTCKTCMRRTFDQPASTCCCAKTEMM